MQSTDTPIRQRTLLSALRIPMSLRTLLFAHAAPVIRIGRRRPVTPDDMLPFDTRLEPTESERMLAAIPTDSIWRMLWHCYWSVGTPARRTLAIALGRLPLVLLSPLLLRWLLEHFQKLSLDPTLFFPTLAIGIGVALTVALDGVVIQHYYYNALWTYARISGGLNMRIYRHALGLDRAALHRRHTGDIVNHMASDTEGVAELSFILPELSSSLILLIGSVALLWSLLGAAALVAIGTMLLLVPLTRAAARRFTTTDDELWKWRDQRVSLISQVLSAIRLIKYFAWERSIERELQQIRTRELSAATRLVRNEALSTVFFLASTTIVAFVGFGAYALMGGALTPAVLFPTLLLLGQLEGPLGNLPHFIKNTAHAYVAAERLAAFFHLPQHRQPLSLPESADPPSVEIRRLTVRYGDTCALNAIELDIRAGEAIALVGTVGSGKTSLLLALLGEVPWEGTILFRSHDGTPCHPRIAYVAQEPFILNATVRENILFGNPDAPLDEIINDAALAADIAQFPAGIETEIGERGVTISGGQKMRIALARAAAAEPSLVLLDDPLAAVDTRTEELLIERLLFGRWGNCTRIVATHRLEHLNRFDRIVVLNGSGNIEAVGTYAELLERSECFRTFVAEHRSAHTSPARHPTATTDGHSAPTQTADGKLGQDEDRAVGVVKAELFWYYVRLFGGQRPAATAAILGGMLLLAVAIVATPMLQSLWLAWNAGQSNWLTVVGGYGALGIGVLAAHYAERRLWMERAIVASQRIHARMLGAVLRAPLRLFDTTPSGRLLNRFARDTQAIDDELAWNFESTMRSFASMLGTLVLITVTAPLVLLIAAPALVVYYRIQRDYRRVAREAKRFESIARSPRYALFKETLHGLLTIRAFGKQGMFLERFAAAMRHYLRMYWSNILINRWFSARAPLVSSAIALVTVVVLVFAAASGTISTGVAGVVLTYTITFWGNLNWCVRAFSEVESRMTSLERVHALGSVQPEPQTTCTPILAAGAPWIDTIAESGASIEFDHVWVRYDQHLPWVLRDVSFRIPAGAHVGIVGRTGSGKTTLFQTLFRFVEPERGRIRIGGIEHCRIPLERLRTAMSVVPQDPVLLLGTVRSNLDRWERFTDQQLWEVLEKVTLADVVAEMGGLDAPIGEQGGNLSQGQRQLLCLGRALLVGARIIVLDEATASIDVLSDAAIRRTLAEHCHGITVLTIAHRPGSVADADLVIELERGQVARISSPTGIATPPVPAHEASDTPPPRAASPTDATV